MKIVGLDLSLTATGWAAWNDAEISFGTVPDTKEKGVRRLIRLEVDILSRAYPMVDLLIMEDLSFGSKGAAVHEIAALHYFIRRSLYVNTVPYLLVSPGSLKKFVTGKGNTEKSHMMLEVFKRFGISPGDDNQADAIGLLHIGMAIQGVWTPTTEGQRDVIDALRNPKAKTKKRRKAA